MMDTALKNRTVHPKAGWMATLTYPLSNLQIPTPKTECQSGTQWVPFLQSLVWPSRGSNPQSNQSQGGHSLLQLVLWYKRPSLALISLHLHSGLDLLQLLDCLYCACVSGFRPVPYKFLYYLTILNQDLYFSTTQLSCVKKKHFHFLQLQNRISTPQKKIFICFGNSIISLFCQMESAHNYF